MNADKQGELLSALMDGESTELELRQLLAAVDDAACERWSRWHLVQNLVQGHACLPQQDAAFSARIQAAIDEVIEEAPVAQRHWLRSLSRVAVAASVALAVVTGWQVWQQGHEATVSAPGFAINASLAQATPASYDIPMTAPQVRYSYSQPDLLRAQPVSDTFAISREEFNRMMARHRLNAGNHQLTSPYGQMVDFTANKQR